MSKDARFTSYIFFSLKPIPIENLINISYSCIKSTAKFARFPEGNTPLRKRT